MGMVDPGHGCETAWADVWLLSLFHPAKGRSHSHSSFTEVAVGKKMMTSQCYK